ncbi:CHASE domain-containing protein, partial [Synergistaceae bacterium OttesenSCG-928-I11]|nr:CHASE domain-containing protein [Synergistaceae bacterium OttesenSCG-928-I11]
MPNVSSKNGIRKERRVSTRAVAIFFVALALCSLMTGFTIRNKSNLERLTMERLILEHSVKITEVISKLLHKTQALSALVIQGNGGIENFDRVAATIVDDPAILNILIAPNGVVSHVYPEEGNEKLVGFNILGGDDAGNREAVAAYESDALVFGGPFELMQGGRAMVGRLPVWIDESNNVKRFWGLVSVTLKYPEALDGAALDSIEKQGFAYEIWRINPDDGKRQVIMSGKSNVDAERFRFIEKHIPILNAN